MGMHRSTASKMGYTRIDALIWVKQVKTDPSNPTYNSSGRASLYCLMHVSSHRHLTNIEHPSPHKFMP